MNRFFQAIRFAIKAHGTDTRKGKEEQYITHPLSVGLLLSSVGAEEDVVIAGILHDTIEDTHVTYADIEKIFGKSIADMVNDVTEQDKGLPWGERKQLALAHIAHMSHGSLLVKTADVLHNMRDQIEDYKIEGDAMFRRFNAPKEAQRERYQKLVKELKKHSKNNPLLPTLERSLKELELLWAN